MAFFDSLISDNNTIPVIDLGHQNFRNFFIVVQKIGFFEELRAHAIEPVVLFMVDPDSKSAKAYSMLQRWFAGVPLLPVRNQVVARGMPYRDAFPNAGVVPVSPEIPELGPSLKALVEQQSFSFGQFWRKALQRFPARLDDELRPWMKRIFFQFRQIDICLMGENSLGGSELVDIPQTFPSDRDRRNIRKPPAVMSERQSAPSGLKFACENGDPADAAFVPKLQQAASLSNENCNRATAVAYMLSAELRDAQQRVNELEREASERPDRARAEAEAALARSQAEADARVEQAKRKAEDRARGEIAEAVTRIARLQDELTQAKQRAEQSSVEAAARVEQIKKEADERIARTEADTDERLARAQAEIEGTFIRLEAELVQARQRTDRAKAEAATRIELIKREADDRVKSVQGNTHALIDQVIRLEAELANAKRRAERAEYWLSRIRDQIEGDLIPSFTSMLEGRTGPS
jgi:hypothetical protein